MGGIKIIIKNMKTFNQFVNEMFNDMEDASEIFIEISNEEELIKLKNIVSKIHGYDWPDDCEPENVYVYPYYLFFNLNKKQYNGHQKKLWQLILIE